MRQTTPNGELRSEYVVYKIRGKPSQVCRCYKLQMPSGMGLSVEQRNRNQDTIRQGLRALRSVSGVGLQCVCESDNDFSPAYQRYYEQTRQNKVSGLSKRHRDAIYVGAVEAMHEGRHLKPTTYLWVSHQVGPVSKCSSAEVETLIEERCREIELVAESASRIFEGGGGKLVGLSSEETFNRVYQSLNNVSRPVDQIDFSKPLKLDHIWNSDTSKLKGARGIFWKSGQFHMYFVLKELPPETFPGIINGLILSGQSGVCVCMNVRPIDVENELKDVEIRRQRVLDEYANTHSEKLLSSIQLKNDRIKKLQTGEELPSYVQLVVQASDPVFEELQKKGVGISQFFLSIGAESHQPSPFRSSQNFAFATWPGNVRNRYTSLYHYAGDSNLADLLPVWHSPIGYLASADALFEGLEGQPVGAKVFLGRQRMPQHGVVVGMNGAGKSMIAQSLLAQTEALGFGYTLIMDRGGQHKLYASTIEDHDRRKRT